MAPITANVSVPPRSRNFSTDDARAVLDMFQGRSPVVDDEGNPTHDDEGNPVYEDATPAENVGYGEYGTTGAARSAAVTLNRLLEDLGAPHKYAATTFQRDGKIVGVLLNKPAKVRESKDEAPKPATRPRRSRRSS